MLGTDVDCDRNARRDDAAAFFGLDGSTRREPAGTAGCEPATPGGPGRNEAGPGASNGPVSGGPVSRRLFWGRPFRSRHLSSRNDLAKDAGDPESDDLSFYEALPASGEFADLIAAKVYRSVPDDWFVGVADIVGSTEALQAGGYKIVNTVAAAVIAGIANGLPGRSFPFVFSGDGCGFCLPAIHRSLAETVLRSVSGWARDAFGLHLRIATVPLSAIRAAGLDVKLARHAPSASVAYAMFSGGGLAFAERRMKAGDYLLEPAASGEAAPDLAGLYCRFAEIPARHGVILSLVVLPPEEGGGGRRYETLIGDVLAIAGDEGDGNPVPGEGPRQVWPPAGLEIEAKTRAATHAVPLWRARLSVLLRSLLAHLTFLSGQVVGGFDPARYVGDLVRNTDFRKFDDGLRMTLDCTPDLADRLEARLATARRRGIARVGSHRQDASLMTCFVPSSSRSDHVHFVDGATGGYAVASAMATSVRSGRTEQGAR